MPLINSNISWYSQVFFYAKIVDICGEFSNFTLLGTLGGINYNLILARCQMGYAMKDKPKNLLVEELFFVEGKDEQGLKSRIVHARHNIHRKDREEFWNKDCVVKDPYTKWVKEK